MTELQLVADTPAVLEEQLRQMRSYHASYFGDQQDLSVEFVRFSTVTQQ
ncbi:MAG: hypothetical protein GY784_15745 [Gammaproteobacteria bacterium]|nr:hypothetical protein [Gammaproteobacteria bacterium]